MLHVNEPTTGAFPKLNLCLCNTNTNCDLCLCRTYFLSPKLVCAFSTNLTRDSSSTPTPRHLLPRLFSTSQPASTLHRTPPFAMRLFDCALLLCLARHYSRKKRRPYKHSRYRKDFFKRLSIEERRRRYRKIPRSALIPLALSPWRKLLASRNDQAFITMMGFDCESFDRLLDKFGPMFSGHTPFDTSGMIVAFEYVSGRKREVQAADCLGLVLVWTRTRGPLNVLQLVFGLTLTNLSVY